MNRRIFITGALSTVLMASTQRNVFGQVSTPVVVEGSSKTPAQVGETVAGDGFEMTLNSVELSSILEDREEAGEGEVFMICDFTLRNVGDKEKSYNRLGFAAKDMDTGFTFDEETLIGDNAFGSGDLEGGDLLRGFVAFKVFTNSGNIRIKYDVENFFLGNDTEFFWTYDVQEGLTNLGE